MRLNTHSRLKAHREASAPIGGELSITAGEPKANLRTEPPYNGTPWGSNFPLPRVSLRLTRGQRGAVTRQGPGPRTPVHARRRDEVRPPWGRSCVWFLSAGALRLPAVIKSATPMGSAASRPCLTLTIIPYISPCTVGYRPWWTPGWRPSYDTSPPPHHQSLAARAAPRGPGYQ